MTERGAVELPSSTRTSVGRYELFAKLGSGGQADVFLAVARGLADFSKLSVVKKLKASDGESSLLVEMFLDEARLAARLAHPNIVHTYEVGEQAGAYFIAMEYLEGQPLSKLARAKRARPVADATWAAIVADALAGLHYAHELADYDGEPLEIVHRDVSPQNLFVTYEGRTKVVDFGVAKAAMNRVVTETGALKGKIAYMAPEQVLGVCDRRADLFAMGAVLWELVAGRRLFEGDSVQVLHRLMTEREPVPSLLDVCPGVDPMLAAVVARALERNPEHRYATAEEMRLALEPVRIAAGIAGTHDAVREVMTRAFGDFREGIRRRVQEAMRRTSLATIRSASFVAAASELAASTPSMAPVTMTAHDDRSTPSFQVPLPMDRTRAAPPSRRGRIAAGVGAFVVTVGAALLLHRAPPRAAASGTAPPLPTTFTAPMSIAAPTASTEPGPAPVATVTTTATAMPGPASVPAPRAHAWRPAPQAPRAQPRKNVRVIDDDRTGAGSGIAIIGD